MKLLTSDVNIFLDTNIIVYLYSDTELKKQQLVKQIVEDNNNLLVSTQVINEFINVMRIKRNVDNGLVKKAFLEIINAFEVYTVTLETIEKALLINAMYRYSYFDSLMIAAALQTNSSILLSEDMHNTQIIEKRLRIINPFAEEKISL